MKASIETINGRECTVIWVNSVPSPDGHFDLPNPMQQGNRVEVAIKD